MATVSVLDREHSLPTTKGKPEKLIALRWQARHSGKSH